MVLVTAFSVDQMVIGGWKLWTCVVQRVSGEHIDEVVEIWE